MWQAVWKIEMHKTWPWFLPVLLVVAAYVVFWPAPLGSSDPLLALLGGVGGCVLSFRLFSDPGGSAAFVFSRPLSRRRLFLYRWLIGIGLQTLTILVVLALLALGVRQAVQAVMFRSPWYPMVRWYEIAGLWPIVGTSFVLYQAASFLIVRHRLLRSSRDRSPSRLARLGRTVWGVLLAILAVLMLLLILRAVIGLFLVARFPIIASPVLLPYAAVLGVMTTLGALWCYRRLEVEA